MTALAQERPVEAPPAPPVAPAPVRSGGPEGYVQLRQPTGLTLAGLLDQIGSQSTGVRTADVATREIEFHLDANQANFRIGADEVPATRAGVLAFGDLLGVPSSFLNRVATELGGRGPQFLLTELLQLYPKSALTVTYGPGGVSKVAEAGRHLIDAERIVSVATRVLGTDAAPVTRIIDTSQEFAFDVRVPEDFDRGVGGDRQVGDITAGGVRLSYNRKRNLAPAVQPYLYRLACTNGMSHLDPGLKVDARGLDVDTVLSELEAAAERAFSRVEDQIRAFYDLREQRVEHPERALLAIAAERKIPERTTTRLLRLASSDALPDDPSMFDIVNLVTNTANDGAIHNDGGRLILENAGGALVAAHEARCAHCQHRVAD